MASDNDTPSNEEGDGELTVNQALDFLSEELRLGDSADVAAEDPQEVTDPIAECRDRMHGPPRPTLQNQLDSVFGMPDTQREALENNPLYSANVIYCMATVNSEALREIRARVASTPSDEDLEDLGLALFTDAEIQLTERELGIADDAQTISTQLAVLDAMIKYEEERIRISCERLLFFGVDRLSSTPLPSDVVEASTESIQEFRVPSAARLELIEGMDEDEAHEKLEMYLGIIKSVDQAITFLQGEDSTAVKFLSDAARNLDPFPLESIPTDYNYALRIAIAEALTKEEQIAVLEVVKANCEGQTGALNARLKEIEE